MEENFDEIWKDIPGYEGLYQISNLGNVKSLNYKRTGKEYIMKPGNCCGYKYVGLSKNGIVKMFSIHRLVSEAFIENPNNWPCVNHKDEDKTNNCMSNLEWCSYKYNSNYGTRNQRRIETLNLNHRKTGQKPVLQFTLDGKFLIEFKSINEASGLLHINPGNICKCCKGKYKQSGGYIFKFKD